MKDDKKKLDPRLSELITVAKAAKQMDIAIPSVHYHILRGNIRSFRVGRDILVMKSEVKKIADRINKFNQS